MKTFKFVIKIKYTKGILKTTTRVTKTRTSLSSPDYISLNSNLIYLNLLEPLKIFLYIREHI